jgi:hypothetical protein
LPESLSKSKKPGTKARKRSARTLPGKLRSRPSTAVLTSAEAARLLTAAALRPGPPRRSKHRPAPPSSCFAHAAVGSSTPESKPPSCPASPSPSTAPPLSPSYSPPAPHTERRRARSTSEPVPGRSLAERPHIDVWWPTFSALPLPSLSPLSSSLSPLWLPLSLSRSVDRMEEQQAAEHRAEASNAQLSTTSRHPTRARQLITSTLPFSCKLGARETQTHSGQVHRSVHRAPAAGNAHSIGPTRQSAVRNC